MTGDSERSQEVSRSVYVPMHLDRELVAEAERLEWPNNEVILECIKIVLTKHKDELRKTRNGVTAHA